jgi:hypothetical protein
VLQLFRRHVQPGMTLGELSRILGGARWLANGQVYKFIVMAGYVPVKGSTLEGSIFSLHTSPASDLDAVYLSLPGNISAQELLDALRGTPTDPRLLRIRVIDVWPRLPYANPH